MSISSKFLVAVVALAGFALVGCGKNDLSTPKAAAQSFAKAMESGDAEAAKAACTGADPKIIEAMAGMSATRKKLHDAAVAKFGDDAKSIGSFDGNDADMKKMVDESEEKIDGDTATLKPKSGEPLKLKKIDGSWKVDMSQHLGMGDTAEATKMMGTMSKAAGETADEINAGKYKTAKEAEQAMQQKMMSSMMPSLPK
jgi:hypothetical protein